ncbi:MULTISPECIES: SDR family oxidoreductase [unclassified Achromobacter]|uniref:SDR family oxidoreductase n=1 Tax=unclassified Achromobacter TaxID=2626865 RepID=UPI000B515B39|nr:MULTISPECIES: SDR family oxidoreductase [unclassified Achromobacter]OWT71377.1 short-chain dehydrogenase [Achromobacter sp. HZ34]OWT73342.1 short-chain dehydrogenase [Achromobacter sp. HZ28]
MSKLCEGRVVIVTGAGRGIGREYAMQLAAHGAKVVVNDLGVSRDGIGQDLSAAQAVVDEIRAAGGDAIANGDDVADWNGARQMIESTVAHYGALHALVNNAGILRDRMLVNMEESEWDAIINVHLKGTFATAHHAAVHWRSLQKLSGERVNARIINTSSSSGLYGNIGQTNYGAAKAGIAALTVIAARELKRYGVTVNAISPHAQTRMTENLRERTPEEIAARHPRWIAPVVVWLASAASAEVTGRVFEVGGGHLSAMEGWHRGPEAEPVDDPERIGPVLLDLARRARRNADMKGHDLD